MEPDDVHRRRSILDQYQRLWRTQRVNFSIAVENQKESSVSLFLSIVWSFVLFDKRKKKNISKLKVVEEDVKVWRKKQSNEQDYTTSCVR